MKPDMHLAPDSSAERVEIYFDGGSRTFGIRQSIRHINDKVYVNYEKSIEISPEDLIRLMDEAKKFIPSMLQAYGKNK